MADPAAELTAMTAAYEALRDLDKEQLPRALGWLTDALGATAPVSVGATPMAHALVPSNGSTALPTPAARNASTSGRIPTPKEFIREKKPQSGAERIACLAYYLTEYRSTPHFKAPDIVALNTEAAQTKIGNPSRDVDNAERGSGYLASAGNGNKQLAARGEALVLALPDRDAVKASLDEHPMRKRVRKAASKKSAAPKKMTTGKKAATKLPKP